MKLIIISLLLLFTVNAQTVWYVDRDSPMDGGVSDGKSWATAWNKMDSTNYTPLLGGINWAILQAGDTIYVSGGSDSTTYIDASTTGGASEGTQYTYADGDPVVIANAWQSGHNGTVYFSAIEDEIKLLNKSNVKYVGITFTNEGSSGVGVVDIGNGSWADSDSLIYLDNCHIKNQGVGSAIFISGTKTTITNSLIENLTNNNADDQDPFGISSGKGGHTIDGCTIIMRNGNDTTTAHRDGIQISNIGYSGMTDYTRLPFTISNNLIIDTNPLGINWNNMIYNYGWDYTPPIDFLIYNNIIVTQKMNTSVGGIAMGRLTDDYLNTLKLLNNTIILKNNGSGTPITNWALDTLIVKNNLIIVDTTVDNFYNINIGYDVYDIDYNYYAEYDSILDAELFTTRSSTYTWSEWQTAGYDTNSYVATSSNVTFSEKYGLDKADYYTETGRDLGVDLSATYPFLATDILGNPRSGSWDIGALEYQTPSGIIRKKSRVIIVQ